MAECLLCLYNMPLLNAPLGPAGDPVGLCGNCSCLSCGWHGGRTATTTPTFLCIVCDDHQLFASAGRDDLSPGDWRRVLHRLRVGVGQGARRGPASDEDIGVELARALAASVSAAGGGRRLRTVATLEQWFTEHPHYQTIMAALSGSVDRAVAELDALFGVSPTSVGRKPVARPWPVADLEQLDHDAIRSLWVQLRAEDRRLLAAAVLLTIVLKIPPDLLAPPVPFVATALGTMLRESVPGEIEALSGKITRPQTHRG